MVKLLISRYKKLFYAMTEQAIYSVGNLLLSIYIINNFPSQLSGQILFILSIAIVSAGICGACFVETAMVFERAQGKTFVASSGSLIFRMTVIVVACQVLFFALDMPPLSEMFTSVGIIILTGVFFSLRKSSNVSEMQGMSVISSCVYFSSLMLMLLVLPDGKNSILLAIFLSLVFGIFTFIAFTKMKRACVNSTYCIVVLKEERYLVLKNVLLSFLYWLPMNGIYIIAALCSNEEVISESRKYLNLFIPIFQFNSVFAVYYLSRLTVSETSHTKMLFNIGFVVNLFYAVMAMLGGEVVYKFLYRGSDEYSQAISVALALVAMVVFCLNRSLARAKIDRDQTAIGKAYLMCVPIFVLFYVFSDILSVNIVVFYICVSYVVVTIALRQFVGKKSLTKV
ncbi:hypothetical protein NFH98_08495 [Halomonas sp. H33-56]|uniref:hypothetical protein n=1 Tax=Halomonas sp. H33-56 TaxID=2950873 RepID=UPI0032DFCED3